MRHQFFDHHRQGNSLIHKADPRLKLFVLVIYVFTVIFVPNPSVLDYMALLALVMVLAIMSRVSLLHYLSKLLKIYPMILLIFIFIPFFPSLSETHFTVGNVKIYNESLQRFFEMNVKAILVLLVSIVLTTTTDFMRFLKGMEILKFPRITLAILSFMYRFIFLFIDEIERMILAYRSRYIKLNYWRRFKTFTGQFALLFIRTFERGERVYISMESRGFDGTISILGHLSWKPLDSIFLSIFLLFIVFIILI
jgi:cobalt/nickel transport system permease protein